MEFDELPPYFIVGSGPGHESAYDRKHFSHDAREMHDFFDRNIHTVAKDLLGCSLVRQLPGQRRSGRIVEVEVYEGENDAASHARSGCATDRTWPMFDDPGRIYVYTIYGMYQCLNLRAPSESGPGAILIRACAPTEGHAAMAVDRNLVDHPDGYNSSLNEKLMSGPGKLCQALSIGPELSGEMINDGPLQLSVGEPSSSEKPSRIERTARVGLNPDTCGEAHRWQWRYMIAGSPWTSCHAG